MKFFIQTILIFYITSALFAEQIDKRDFDITKEIISEQIKAFKKNDATKAYSFADSFIKMKFKNPESFMGMIKDNYEPVSNAKDFYFIKSKFYDGSIFHQLQIISQSNQSYIATYSLVFVDEEWKISGCALSLMKQQSI